MTLVTLVLRLRTALITACVLLKLLKGKKCAVKK